jgi:hypothetical protein
MTCRPGISSRVVPQTRKSDDTSHRTSHAQHDMTVPGSKHQLSRNRCSKFLELAKKNYYFTVVEE